MDVVGRFIGRRAPTVTIPLPMLVIAAGCVQVVTGGKSAVHPDRVRKVATSTHIVPKFLMESGFRFRYGFEESLKHWASLAPDDFS